MADAMDHSAGGQCPERWQSICMDRTSHTSRIPKKASVLVFKCVWVWPGTRQWMQCNEQRWRMLFLKGCMHICLEVRRGLGRRGPSSLALRASDHVTWMLLLERCKPGLYRPCNIACVYSCTDWLPFDCSVAYMTIFLTTLASD